VIKAELIAREKNFFFPSPKQIAKQLALL